MSEVQNERIFGFVRLESVVCDPSADVCRRRGCSAVALAEGDEDRAREAYSGCFSGEERSQPHGPRKSPRNIPRETFPARAVKSRSMPLA